MTDPLSQFSDPLSQFCRRGLSTDTNINNLSVVYPKGYDMLPDERTNLTKFTSPDKYKSNGNVPSLELIDIVQYAALQDANKIISKTAGDVAKQAYYEFSRLPKPFINVSAIRLANVIESNGLSYSKYGYLRKRSNYVFNFLDLGGAPGGFSQYLLWKYPHSKGFGVSLNSGLKWQSKNLPMDRLKLWTNEKGKTGNVLLEWADIGPFAAKSYGIPGRDYGLDLVLGNINPETGGDKIPKTEIYLAPVILAESIIALESLREGGDFILQVYDTVTPFTADVLYLLNLVFEEVVIFRATSTPFYNTEKFIVCKKYIGLDNVGNALDIMKNGMKHINKMMVADKINQLVASPIKVPDRLIKNDLPPNFIKYLYKWNVDNLNFMTLAVSEVIDKIIGLIEGLKGIDVNDDNQVMLAVDRMSYKDLKEKIPTNHNYNISRLLTYLNLPELPVHLVPDYAIDAYDGDVSPTNGKDKLNLAKPSCKKSACKKKK